MKRKFLALTIIGILVAGGSILRCNIETASGPTPYAVFSGEGNSSTPNSIGTGIKSFIIPGSLVFSGIGRWATITPDSADTTFYMKGIIKDYNRNSGTFTINVTDFNGTGEFEKWNVVVEKTMEEVLDSVKQAYADLSFGMFYHFNMSTFARHSCDKCYSVSGEWGRGKSDAPAQLFRPSQLNCGQWADAAKVAGCKYMILVAKHHDGFCLWPTAYTDYSVKNAAVTTDVCKQFADSARSRGMRVGFYYSIRDLTNGIGIDFIKGQLTELLTNYGDVLCLWFDGWGWDAGYDRVPYDTVRALIKNIQPNCLIVENNHEFSTKHSEMLEWEMPIDGAPPITNKIPAEGNEPIRYSPTDRERCWFWHPKGNCDLMTAQMILDHLRNNNKGNAAYLLDLTPDTLGLIPDCQVERMKEVGQLLGVSP